MLGKQTIARLGIVNTRVYAGDDLMDSHEQRRDSKKFHSPASSSVSHAASMPLLLLLKDLD